MDIDRGECEWQEDLQLFPNSLVNRLRSDIREFLPKGAQRNDPTRTSATPCACTAPPPGVHPPNAGPAVDVALQLPTAASL